MKVYLEANFIKDNMKHLERFDNFNNRISEELSPHVYKRAASKLSKMGMPKRAKALQDWSEKQRMSQNMADWKRHVDELKGFGTFKFTIKDEDKVPGQELLTDDFYLVIDFDSDAFEDETLFNKTQIGDHIENGYIAKLYLMTGLVPTNEDTIKKCEESLPDPDDLSNGFYWGNVMEIKMEIKNDKVTLSELKFDSYDPSVSGNPLVADRRSAVKLKNLLKSIFLNEINFPSGRTDVKYMYEHLENSILNKCGFSGDYGFELKDIADLIQKTHISQFPGYIE